MFFQLLRAKLAHSGLYGRPAIKLVGMKLRFQTSGSNGFFCSRFYKRTLVFVQCHVWL